MSKHWKELVAEKRSQQATTIPKEWILKDLPSRETSNVIDFPEKCGLLSATEVEITNSEFGVLLEKLASKTWSAVLVTTAFSKRAIIAHQLVNCLTEIFIDQALKRAAELDQYLETNGKVVGPLHGLPISLKDQICIKGIESTMGYASWIGHSIEKNSVLVDELLAYGAVLYVKTNVPQTLMWAETYNLVFGRTLNPYNRSLTCGGSSGGEGALIALKGSPLGVGSDIGGSIRIPSAFNGLYGLRPSYGRIPYARCVNSIEGQDSVLSVLGPMSNSMGAIKSFIKNVVDQRPWLQDPLAVKKPWNEEEYRLVEHGDGKSLCFGIIWDDEAVVPHPPVIRALEKTKEALLSAGHQVIDWKPLKHKEICASLLDIWNAASSEDYRTVTQATGEPIISSMDPEAEEGVDDEGATLQAFEFVPKHPTISSFELWQVQKKKNDFRLEYWDHWNASIYVTGTGRPVDALISPCAPFAAPPHGRNNNTKYTSIWNGLDYVALVVPTGLSVDPILDKPQVRQNFYNKIDKSNYEFYHPDKFKDAPLCIQVVGRTLEEEAVIAMGEIVDLALKNLK